MLPTSSRVNYNNGTPIALPTSATPETIPDVIDPRLAQERRRRQNRDLQQFHLYQKLNQSPERLIDGLSETAYQAQSPIGPIQFADSAYHGSNLVSPNSPLRIAEGDVMDRSRIPNIRRPQPMRPQTSNTTHSVGRTAIIPPDSSVSKYPQAYRLQPSLGGQAHQAPNKPSSGRVAMSQHPHLPKVYYPSIAHGSHPASGERFSPLQTGIPTNHGNTGFVVPAKRKQPANMLDSAKNIKRPRMESNHSEQAQVSEVYNRAGCPLPSNPTAIRPYDNKYMPSASPFLGNTTASAAPAAYMAVTRTPQQVLERYQAGPPMQGDSERRRLMYQELQYQQQVIMVEQQKYQEMMKVANASMASQIQSTARAPCQFPLTESNLAQMQLSQQQQSPAMYSHAQKLHRDAPSLPPTQPVLDPSPLLHQQQRNTQKRPMIHTPLSVSSNMRLVSTTNSAMAAQQQFPSTASHVYGQNLSVMPRVQQTPPLTSRTVNKVHPAQSPFPLPTPRIQRPPAAAYAPSPFVRPSAPQTSSAIPPSVEQQYHAAGQHIQHLATSQGSQNNHSSIRQDRRTGDSIQQPHPRRPGVAAVLENKALISVGSLYNQEPHHHFRAQVHVASNVTHRATAGTNVGQQPDTIPGTAQKRRIAELEEDHGLSGSALPSSKRSRVLASPYPEAAQRSSSVKPSSSPAGPNEVVIIDDEEPGLEEDVGESVSASEPSPIKPVVTELRGPLILSNDEYIAFLQSGHAVPEQWLAAEKEYAEGYDNVEVPDTLSEERLGHIDSFLAGMADLDYPTGF